MELHAYQGDIMMARCDEPGTASRLRVGLSSWIIQDGNYNEFEVGHEYRFALEFFPHEIVASADSNLMPRLTHISGALHNARGKILFRSEAAWVIDFSVPAYREESAPDWAKVGTWVSGRIYVGVDPFFYFERLKNEIGMPNIFRQWFVRRILRETTPWRETTNAQGTKILSRDATRESFVEVPATDAWHHDGGHADYLLECELRSDDVLPGGAG
jgi:hypothetical protein